MNYEIRAVLCRGCGLCIRSCPERAIRGQMNRPHEIDPSKCTGCAECMKVCRFDAIRTVKSE